jgi:predicted RND superfamily exporter protein
MNDDQFSVIRYSAGRDTLTAVFGVMIILWLALHSWKIVAAVFFSLMVGLAVTAALGLVLVSSFNLISIALFVLFVGLGVDFGIQFSVRYRTERYEHPDLYEALRSAARKAGNPLSLAAAATAAGFFAFLPTSYRGLSELGLIAGCGMLVAFRLQHHIGASELGAAQASGRGRADRLPKSRAARRFPSEVSHCGDRQHVSRRSRRYTAVIPSAVRLQSGRSAKSEFSFRGDLSRIAERSGNQRQRC